MKYFIFRNSTVELFFNNLDSSFSDYDSISDFPLDKDVYVWFYLIPLKFDKNNISKEILSYEDRLEFIINKIPTSKRIYIFTMNSFFDNNLILSDFNLNITINNFNNKIYNLQTINSNIKIIDFSIFLTKYNAKDLINWKYFYLSQTIINPKLANDFKIFFENFEKSANLIRKKCLILDLDNTLWGGIVGEDGINNIKIGGDYPGNVYLDFQKLIYNLYNCGIILVICSKNNEKDILDLFDSNQNMFLKKQHFAMYKINWENKAKNIIDLSNDLNIGLDSMVFIDDNPSERELVKKMIPNVLVPDFPQNIYDITPYFNEIFNFYFGVYNLTTEDLNKTKQYVENQNRSTFKNQFININDFLKSLCLNLTISFAKDSSLTRISQMTQKTNQFNLTTIRYTDQQIVDLFNNPNYYIYTINVSDKFGDNGLTGVLIINCDKEKSTAYIESFLLSCRILGKKIENEFLNFVLNDLKNKNFELIFSQYIKSEKNSQVENFYDLNHFNLISEQNSIKKYSISLKNFQYNINKIYNINYE